MIKTKRQHEEAHREILNRLDRQAEAIQAMNTLVQAILKPKKTTKKKTTKKAK